MSTIGIEELLAALMPLVVAGLDEWYRPGAVVSSAPSARVREWSLVMRVPLAPRCDCPPAVLVKIRRRPGLSLWETVTDPELVAEARDELEALAELERIVAHAANPGFRAVRPLARFDQWNAVVMEELAASPIKARLSVPSMLLSLYDRSRLETVFERTGNLLRLFHDQGAAAFSAPPASEEVCASLADDLAFLRVRVGRHLLDPVDAVTSLTGEGSLTDVPFRNVHRNFNLGNVLVTGDDQVAFIDTHRREEPDSVYVDIAKMMVEMESFRLRALTHRRIPGDGRTERLHEALLCGYFGTSEYNRPALDFSLVCALLDRWRFLEEGSRSPHRRRRAVVQRGLLPLTRRAMAMLARRHCDHLLESLSVAHARP